MLTKRQRIDLANGIDGEGFDYYFRSYTDCRDIEDEEFQKLRKAYIEAAEVLEEYMDLDSLEVE